MEKDEKIFVNCGDSFAIVCQFRLNAHAAEAKLCDYNSATYPPFDFQDKNGQYTGIDQEILKTVAGR